MADDLFGFLDPNVPKSLTPPEGYEGVHRPGDTWARQGDRTVNTSWLTAKQWNHLIAQFRGLAVLNGVDVSDVAKTSPLLLQTFITRAIHAVLSGVDLGDDYLVMRKAEYDTDKDGKVDLAAGGTGVSATSAIDLRSKLGITSAIDTAISALGAIVVNKGLWDTSTGTFPGGGSAKNGWAYIVSVAGTVGGVDFTVGDRALALADNASTTTYAGNWLKLDYTDQVLSVAGLTGAITAAALRTALSLAAIATSGSASDLAAGTVPDAQLPPRLRAIAVSVANWNTVTDGGWYYSSPGAGKGAPNDVDWFRGRVDPSGFDTYLTQTAQIYISPTEANGKTYRRYRINGVWSAWFRLYLSKAEQAALWTSITDLASTDPGKGAATVGIEAIAGLPGANTVQKALAALALLGAADQRKWQDVTADRALGTIYQNTENYTIAVAARTSGGGADPWEVSETGSAPWIPVGLITGDGLQHASYFEVPPGHSYRANQSAARTLTFWSELR